MEEVSCQDRITKTLLPCFSLFVRMEKVILEQDRAFLDPSLAIRNNLRKAISTKLCKRCYFGLRRGLCARRIYKLPGKLHVNIFNLSFMLLNG